MEALTERSEETKGSTTGETRSLVDRIKRYRYRNEVLMVLVMLVAIQLFPRSTPVGIYGLGVVAGAGLALNAIGVVLVYRSNGFINFAQVAFGAFGAALFSVLARARPMLRWASTVCGECIDAERPSALWRNLNYIVSMGIGLGVAILFSWITYVLVIKRFRNAPPLMLMVATIFVTPFFGTIMNWILPRLITNEQKDAGFQLGGPAKLPFDVTFGNTPQFHLTDILTVVLALGAMAGLFLYFRLSLTGMAIRASAENAARAETLGVPVGRVTSRVWVIAGALSGVAATLQVASGGGGGISGDGLLVQILLVAVIARLTSLPVVAASAIALGVLRQAVLWAYGSIAPLDGSLFLILGVVLLAQRHHTSRADVERAAAFEAAKEIRPIPRELRGLPPVRRWQRNGALFAGLLVLAGPWALTPSQTNLAALYLIYAIVAMSLLMLIGWAGQVSLGHFAFAAVGAYVTALVGLPFPISLLVGAAAGGVVALVVGVPALRLRGLHLALSTLAFALAVSSVLLNPDYLGKKLPSVIDRPKLLGMDLDDQRVFYYVTLLIVTLVFMGVVGLRNSRTARALIASRDNEQAAQSFGIDLVRARLTAFALSGFFAALAGSLFAYHQSGVKAASFTPGASIQMFLIAVIGGLGAVWGPLVGALYYGLPNLGLPVLSLPIVAELTTGLGGLLLVLYLGSGGLAAFVARVRDNMLRRVAKRYRILVPSLIADQKKSDFDERAPLIPNLRAGGGGEAFIPRRYALKGQWAVGMTAHLVKAGDVGSGEASRTHDEARAGQ